MSGDSVEPKPEGLDEVDPTDAEEAWRPSFSRSDPEPILAARARTIEHMRHLLAGATASLALAGCSSPDGPKLDDKAATSGGTPPDPSVTAATATGSPHSSALPISPSAAPSASESVKDAGAPDAAPKPPTVRHPMRKPHGYEVVDMLPPPPFFFRRKRKQKKDPKA